MLCRPFGASSHATRPHIFVPTFEIQFKNMEVDKTGIWQNLGGKLYTYIQKLKFYSGSFAIWVIHSVPLNKFSRQQTNLFLFPINFLFLPPSTSFRAGKVPRPAIAKTSILITFLDFHTGYPADGSATKIQTSGFGVGRISIRDRDR